MGACFIAFIQSMNVCGFSVLHTCIFYLITYPFRWKCTSSVNCLPNTEEMNHKRWLTGLCQHWPGFVASEFCRETFLSLIEQWLVDVCFKPSCWDSCLTDLPGLQVSTSCTCAMFSSGLTDFCQQCLSCCLPQNQSAQTFHENLNCWPSWTLFAVKSHLKLTVHHNNTAGLIQYFHTKHTVLSNVRQLVHSCLQNFLLGNITNL
jgi:hypothetical protein